jgi:tetratricopeptide (TPR) repeat protein
VTPRDHDTSPDVEGAATPATVDHGHLDKERRVPIRIDSGTTVGRYLVVDKIGEGGMGIVYRAYDPELDRKIALKLVGVTRRDPESAARARARLLREAQALAKLSHPNVIAIHDAGTYGDDVFLAMELVEGPSLRAWLREPRSEREIRAVFVDAGRGLAAAHDAGLVHRDFKPDNVIVGADGRARVLDFGLARAAGIAAEDVTGEVRAPAAGSAQSSGSLPGPVAVPLSVPVELETGPKRLSTPLTQAGAVMGTPAYMAPEQHVHGHADARSDQFSFCVALYEALSGKRPTVVEKTAGPAEPGEAAKPAKKLPPWLHRIVARGLAVAASERYPDMTALLADLSRDPAARRRKLAVGGAIAALTAVAGFAIVNALGDDDRCGGAAGKLAGVWDAGMRARLDQAFAKGGRGHGPATAVRVGALLDRQATAWSTLHTESCRATARGEQSDRMLDLRAACLDRRRDELGALSGVLVADPGPEVIDRSIAAVLALPAIDICRDDAALEAAVPPPEDPAVRARVAALRKRLDQVEALMRAGELKKGQGEAVAIAAEARDVPYVPFQAAALAALAGLSQDNGKHEEAEALFREVTRLAGEARDDKLVATALIRLIEATARLPARLPEAISLVPAAEGIIARLENRTAVTADLELTLGTAYHRAGKYDDSHAHFERALALAEKGGHDEVQVATILTNLGVLLETQGKYDEAREHLLRSLGIQEEMLGREHPDLAAPLNNLANVAMKQGKYDEAEAHHRRALAIMEKALDPEHPEVAITLNNLAIVLQERGDYAKARELYQRAADIHAKLLGPDDPMIGVGHNNIGEALLLEGFPTEGLAHYERALVVWGKALPAEHPLLAYALTGAAKCRLALGAAVEAVPELERALAIRTGAGEDPVLIAETRFALARALVAARRPRGRAIELAEAALATYRTAGDSYADERTAAETWLAANPR